MSDIERVEQQLASDKREAVIYREQILSKLDDITTIVEKYRDEMRSMHSSHFTKAENQAIQIVKLEEGLGAVSEDLNDHVEGHKRWIIYVAGLSALAGVVMNLVFKLSH